MNVAIAAHLPILAHQLRVPILLLPGDEASYELGQLLGTKRVAALSIVPHYDAYQGRAVANEDAVHAAVDSFAEFIRGIPSQL